MHRGRRRLPLPDPLCRQSRVHVRFGRVRRLDGLSMTWADLGLWLVGRRRFYAVREGEAPEVTARQYARDPEGDRVIVTDDPAKAERIAERQRARIARRN